MAGKDKYGDVTIETGVIINVNPDQFSVDVGTVNSNRRWLDIPVMCPYLNHFGGEGIYALPEAGCQVWICQTSELERSFVLGFGGAADKDGTFRNMRQSMNPGDIYMGGRDKNFIFLRRGGIVQVHATPLAQRMYMPVGNIIKDFCEKYEMRTLAGDLVWQVDRDDSTTTGDRPTRMVIRAKEKADDKNFVAELTLGDNALTGQFLKLQIFDKGGDNPKTVITMTMNKDGDVKWDVDGSWTAEVRGDYKVTVAEGDYKAACNTGSMELLSTSKSVSIRGGTKVEVIAPSIQLGLGGSGVDVSGVDMVKLSGGTSPLVKGEVLMSILSPVLTALASFPVDPTSYARIPASANAALAQLPNLLSTKSKTG